MEKLNKYLVLFLIAICSAYTLDGFAQNDTAVEKEVVVITKMVDDNGNETIETQTFVTSDLQAIDMDQMIDVDMSGEEMEVEVEVNKIIGTPFLGVEVENTADNSGVRITSVADDSPAAKQDLAVGDIITAIGEAHVANVSDFESALSTQGLTPYVVVNRSGAQLYKKVTMDPAEVTVEKKVIKKYKPTQTVAKKQSIKKVVKQKVQPK